MATGTVKWFNSSKGFEKKASINRGFFCVSLGVITVLII